MQGGLKINRNKFQGTICGAASLFWHCAFSRLFRLAYSTPGPCLDRFYSLLNPSVKRSDCIATWLYLVFTWCRIVDFDIFFPHDLTFKNTHHTYEIPNIFSCKQIRDLFPHIYTRKAPIGMAWAPHSFEWARSAGIGHFTKTLFFHLFPYRNINDVVTCSCTDVYFCVTIEFQKTWSHLALIALKLFRRHKNPQSV